jgi:hypothetical protein
MILNPETAVAERLGAEAELLHDVCGQALAELGDR